LQSKILYNYFNPMAFTYKHLALAGTFDHLHKGHRALIDIAFEAAATVSLGITTEAMLGAKILPSLILPYGVREEELRSYLTSKNYTSRAVFHPIADIYGPTLTDTSLDGIVVTEESLYNARRVNDKRKEKGMPPLDFVEAPLVRGNDGEVVRSSRIRSGEVNREGFSFASFWHGGLTLTVPDNLRPLLRKPLGEVVREENNLSKTTRTVMDRITQAHPTLLVAVGDVVTHELVKEGLVPDVVVIDKRTRREPADFPTPPIENILSVTSAASTISFDVVRLLEQALRSRVLIGKKWLIEVTGEEDLVALPALLLAPLYSLVVYGQRDVGVVMTQSTEAVKEHIKALLVQFIVQ
jgi:uncharacterized protein (UPF0218 family)/phosphopantetheine adenylyltransferase